jgi:hypothetical protein
MSKHICIKEVPDRQFTIGKIYESTPIGSGWILDDMGTVSFFSKIQKDPLRQYHDYFEDLTSYIRDNKINSLID